MVISQENSKRFTEDNMGARFRVNGNPNSDWRSAEESRNTKEPDWSRRTRDELLTAEELCLHRISGGEVKWKPVLRRIRRALEKARR